MGPTIDLKMKTLDAKIPLLQTQFEEQNIAHQLSSAMEFSGGQVLCMRV